MQILNISVQNRPSKSITSKPYASYFSESCGYTVNMYDWEVPPFFSDSSNYSVAILDGVIREPWVHYKYVEPATHEVSVLSLDITREVLYKKVGIPVEDLTHAVSINDLQITRTVRYLSTTIETDTATHSTSVLDLQITSGG